MFKKKQAYVELYLLNWVLQVLLVQLILFDKMKITLVLIFTIFHFSSTSGYHYCDQTIMDDCCPGLEECDKAVWGKTLFD